MELDVVGFHPERNDLVHYEPSVDAFSWRIREERFRKKFDAGRKYIFRDMFKWLPTSTKLHQVAVLVTHPKGRDTIGGGNVVSIDELVAEIRSKVTACGVMRSNAIPEQYPLLRTIQMSHVGYNRAMPSVPQPTRTVSTSTVRAGR